MNLTIRENGERIRGLEGKSKINIVVQKHEVICSWCTFFYLLVFAIVPIIKVSLVSSKSFPGINLIFKSALFQKRTAPFAEQQCTCFSNLDVPESTEFSLISDPRVPLFSALDTYSNTSSFLVFFYNFLKTFLRDTAKRWLFLWSGAE